MKALWTTMLAGMTLALTAGNAAREPCHLEGIEVPSFDTRSLPEKTFAALHKAVAPKAEAWATIPWEPDLATARRKAAREGKPLLMWVMDGHPLGCT
jgi:hypothetical protein